MHASAWRRRSSMSWPVPARLSRLILTVMGDYRDEAQNWAQSIGTRNLILGGPEFYPVGVQSCSPASLSRTESSIRRFRHTPNPTYSLLRLQHAPVGRGGAVSHALAIVGIMESGFRQYRVLVPEWLLRARIQHLRPVPSPLRAGI